VLTRDGSIADLFMQLVAIPSPSGHERALGEQIRDWCNDAGIATRFDDAGAVNGSDSGNLIAEVSGAAGAPALLFVAHMDTVESGAEPIAPVLEDDGVLRSAGETILGADNKSAVAAVMLACRTAALLPVERRPRVVAAFTCREETGRMGASLLDLNGATIDCAFSVDGSQPIGTVIARSLGQTTFIVSVHGRAAHAAANPEAGINAIAVAAEIVTALPLGRLPGGGSVNVAGIVGGAVIGRLGDDVLASLAVTPTNSVPDVAHIKGEIRGYSVDEIEHTARAIEDTVARVCSAHGAGYDWVRDRDRMVPPLPGSADSPALSLVRAAADDVGGVTVALQNGHATLEANYLAAWTDVVAVASGGRDPHQTSESITVAELDQLQALLERIIELAGAAAL
jgi:tripeptide aminopeptidase